jgi:hypothetical protein
MTDSCVDGLMPRSDVKRQDGRRAASQYLQQLLLKPGAYRQSWERYVSRERRGTINQLAVAEVIARHLWSEPRSPADAQVTPHQLKDTVSRALTGRLLSRPALSLFIGAFGFSEHEAGRLWRLWNGSASIDVLSGSHAVPSDTQRELVEVLGPPKHQTVSLHDHVYVGEDGRIDHARMLHVIEAIAPGVDRIPFLFDTNVLTVEVGQGGKELNGNVQQIGDDMFFAEMLLARTLDLGETITLEYWVTYRFPGDPADQGEREFRRAVMRHAENIDMRVAFHPNKPPARVWWTHWDGTDGDVIQRETVTLDSECSVHRYVRSVDRTVVGFYWQWE